MYKENDEDSNGLQPSVDLQPAHYGRHLVIQPEEWDKANILKALQKHELPRDHYGSVKINFGCGGEELLEAIRKVGDNILVHGNRQRAVARSTSGKILVPDTDTDFTFFYQGQKCVIINSVYQLPGQFHEVKTILIHPCEKFDEARLVHELWEACSQLQVRNRTIIHYPLQTLLTIDRYYSWQDICLPRNISNDIDGMIRFFLERRDWFQRKKLPWKRGLLLTGPPGNGKTLLAKVILTHYRAFSAVIYDLSHKHADSESLYRAYDICHKPAIIILEDIDKAFSNSEKHNKTGGVTLDVLLNVMDGVASNEGVITIATANNPEKLDPALKDRPRRFDRVIHFPNPNVTLRDKFCRRLFGVVADEELIKTVVETTEGYSMAAIEEIYLKSCMDALNNGREDPSREDVRNALQVLKTSKEKGSEKKTGF